MTSIAGSTAGYHWLTGSTGTTDTSCSHCGPHVSSRRRRRPVLQPEDPPIWFITQINHKFLETLPMTHSRLQPATPKLTCSFSYYRSKGTSLPPLETRYHMREILRSLLTNSPNQFGKSTTCAFPSNTPTTSTTTPTCQSERTTSLLQSIDNNGSPCHMDIGLVPASH